MSETKTKDRFPVWAISHGAPTLWWDENAVDIRKEFESLPDLLPRTPKAILCISAHWEASRGFEVTSAESYPELLYDFYGFPKPLYEKKYPCPADPKLANRVCELIKGAGFDCSGNDKRMLDHGVYSPLSIVFPNADIPIVELSLNASNDPEGHYKVGEALQPLRDEDILIVTSGSTLHNLGQIVHDSTPTDEASYEHFQTFDDKVIDSMISSESERKEALLQWQEWEDAKNVHPYPEHFTPFIVAAGAAGSSEGQVTIKKYQFGNLGYTSFQFNE